MRKLLRILAAIFFSFTATACMWDAESLSREKARSHDLAQTIVNNQPIPEDTNHLRATIQVLEVDRHEDDPMWWNNLVVAHLRLGEFTVAVKLLEPIVEKFPNDYGIHANLGTAYHLMGRYQDAEKEIARDLEINPDAHFGLEKYHLALLQYLIRDTKYQSRHVYVDEFTTLFLMNDNVWGFDPYYGEFEESDATTKAKDYATLEAAEADYQAVLKTNNHGRETLRMLATVAMRDAPPAYRKDLDLHHDTNMEAGVIYMAQMNPKEPACYVMLGIAAWKSRNYHLAAVAFDRPISLGSPQSENLKEKANNLREFIRKSQETKWTMRIFLLVVVGVPAAWILWLIVRIVRGERLKAAS
jgi:tetratricopeptide (TPR) repeat protein